MDRSVPIRLRVISRNCIYNDISSTVYLPESELRELTCFSQPLAFMHHTAVCDTQRLTYFEF